MNAERWLSTATGAWWFAGKPGISATEWLGLLGSSGLRNTVSLVPPGAPLIQSLSAISHCQMWCRLCGVDPNLAAIVTALRTVEISDERQRVHSGHLSSIERAATWLAASRLRCARTLVLIEPEHGLVGSNLAQLKRLLNEAIGHHHQTLIVGSDRGIANACGAQPLFVSASDES